MEQGADKKDLPYHQKDVGKSHAEPFYMHGLQEVMLDESGKRRDSPVCEFALFYHRMKKGTDLFLTMVQEFGSQ